MKTTLRLCSMVRRISMAAAMLVSLFAFDADTPINAQSLTATDRYRGHVILKTLKNEIKKNYYDPAFHGLDLETLLRRRMRRSTAQYQ